MFCTYIFNSIISLFIYFLIDFNLIRILQKRKMMKHKSVIATQAQAEI